MTHAAHATLTFLSNPSKLYTKTDYIYENKSCHASKQQKHAVLDVAESQSCIQPACMCSVDFLIPCILHIPNCSPVLSAAAVELCTVQQAGVLLDAGTPFPFTRSQLSLLSARRALGREMLNLKSLTQLVKKTPKPETNTTRQSPEKRSTGLQLICTRLKGKDVSIAKGFCIQQSMYGTWQLLRLQHKPKLVQTDIQVRTEAITTSVTCQRCELPSNHTQSN